MQPVLSILICSIQSRIGMLGGLLRDLDEQIERTNSRGLVEIRVALDNKEKTTGAKRQELLYLSQGQYVIYCDDDDTVDEDYIKEILIGCESGADCIPINGWIETNKSNRIYWRISKDYDNITIKENGVKKYLREVNHICAVRRELALLAGFNDVSCGEDKYYSQQLKPLLKTEYIIEKPLYFYHFSTLNKTYK